MAAYTTIDNPELYFQTKLYTGNASTRSITLDGSEDMQPDLVWIKLRSDNYGSRVVDSVRGATKEIYTNNSSAESTVAAGVTSFDSDGFSLGSEDGTNKNTETIVAWNWKESATAGFDIVSYTGNGSNRTISHSLSATPSMIIVKDRTSTGDWFIYNKNIGATKYVRLNDTGAEASSSTLYQDTDPTSSVFSIGTNGNVNTNTNTYIAYCFAEKQGYSKFGSYTGNGSSDGAFVYTGFRPAWIVVKRTDSANSWMIYDNKRNPENLVDNPLYGESNEVEGTSSAASFDFLSNGFKLRGSGSAVNASGATMIYMAFAEAPFVNSNGVPCNAR